MPSSYSSSMPSISRRAWARLESSAASCSSASGGVSWFAPPTRRRLHKMIAPATRSQPPSAPTAHAQQPPLYAPPLSIPRWQIPPPPPPPLSRTSYAPPPPPPPFRMQEAPIQQTPATITTPMAPIGSEQPPEPSAPRHPLMHGAGRDLGTVTRTPALTGGGSPERPPPSFADFLRSALFASHPPHHRYPRERGAVLAFGGCLSLG